MPPDIGVPARSKAKLAAALTAVWSRPEWDTRDGHDLKDWLVDNVLVHAKHHAYWGNEERWCQEFVRFARTVAKERGTPDSTPDAALANDGLLERFMGHLARSGRGRSVPRAARRHLSAKRMRTGLPSLNANPFIAMVVTGAERAQPATPSQAADIPLEQLETLARAVPQSEGWFDHMVVTMAMTGYVTLMRLVELRAVRRAGLKFVTSTGSKLTATQASRRPRTHMRGLLVHVAWRKQTQDQDCWIPVSCAHTMTRILDHIRNLHRIGYTGTMLFPSRTSVSTEARAHPTNRVGSKSFVAHLRRLMVKHNILTKAQADRVRGHSLRVAGSNNCRRQGVPDNTHRLMGGWASLASSASYMALTHAEQFQVTDRMAVRGARDVGIRDAQEAQELLVHRLPGIRAEPPRQ